MTEAIKTNTRLVQIALPTFNGSRHIGESLRSLLNQTYKDITILVMDNASTDGTSDIVSEIAKRDDRVIHFRSDNFVCATSNFVRAFNHIDLSLSPYFMWASDDDLWDKTFIDKLVADLERRPNAVLAFPKYCAINEYGVLGDEFYNFDIPAFDSFRQITSLLNYGKFSAFYGVLRASALNWNPILSDVSFGSDRWFLLQLASRGVFHLRKEVLFYKRTGGISSSGCDASASLNPDSTWLLDEEEKRQIMALSFTDRQNKSLFRLLQVLAKTYYPEKQFPIDILLRSAIGRIRKNRRALGIRKLIISRLQIRQN